MGRGFEFLNAYAIIKKNKEIITKVHISGYSNTQRIIIKLLEIEK
tara:strand:+ start:4543 stop:4677 length:135 start_codon:yes stop_codon:yes gene_type:complete